MRSRLLVSSFTVMAIVAITASSLAQPPGGPPGGPGGGFLGGGPPFRGGFGRPAISPAISLLQMPEVQTELKLSAQQVEKSMEILKAAHDEMAAVAREFEPAPATGSELEKRIEGMSAKFDAIRTKMEAATKSLLDEKQFARLTQLDIQRHGHAAIFREEIIKKLELTEEQVKAMRKALPPGRFAFGPSGPPPGVEPPPLVRPDGSPGAPPADVLKVLNEKQIAKWKEMQGTAFDFPPGFEWIPGIDQLAPGGGRPPGFGPPGFGPGGPGGGPGGRGFGPMGGQERKLVKQFDTNKDGWLNAEERAPAREEAKKGGGGRGLGPFGGGRGGRGGGPPGGFGGGNVATGPGPTVKKEDVAPVSGGFYDPMVVRTIFFDFENKDWEAEIADFHGTDVDVPATMTVDGKEYKNVGVHFRGASSYGMVPAGSKRSLNVSVDMANSKQRVQSYKTLNLLNSHTDPTFMHTVLYFDAARKYLAAPKANWVRVVVNGESWGLYVNAQQFNKEFIEENFNEKKGARWKVKGSPGGGGGLEYLGDKIEAYKQRYEIKSKDNDDAWRSMMHFCKVLNETKADDLPAAIEPILDVDNALWFLALDCALINSDGYWVRASDYSIYLDEKDKFHFLPHDANETFSAPMGPGMGGGRGGRGGGPGGPGGGPPGGPPGGGPGGGGGRPGMMGGGGRGIELDPLTGMQDTTKPLRSKLLAVPKYRERYLQMVKIIAKEQLDWATLGPKVEAYGKLIKPFIEADTRKLSSTEAFEQTVFAESAERGRSTLKQFAEQRQKYLLSYPEISKLREEEIAPARGAEK